MQRLPISGNRVNVHVPSPPVSYDRFSSYSLAATQSTRKKLGTVLRRRFRCQLVLLFLSFHFLPTAPSRPLVFLFFHLSLFPFYFSSSLHLSYCVFLTQSVHRKASVINIRIESSSPVSCAELLCP